MTDDKFKIALVQMGCDADRDTNLAKAEAAIADAAKKGAQIVCLPELFTGPYFCQTEEHKYFDLAEPIPGPSTERLGKAAKANNVVVVGSLFERRMAGVYHNTATVHDADGSFLGIYRKMHIPHDPLFEEKFYFTPGDLGFRTWKTAHGDIGVLICWDQWYPEAARLTALGGAQILFYPTAIGWLPEEKAALGHAQHNAWETVQRGHGVANGCYVAATNRVGTEGRTQFWGQSFVSDPYGEIVARASVEKEEVLLADCDLVKQREFRRIWPFFRDRRIDAYGDLTRRLRD